MHAHGVLKVWPGMVLGLPDSVDPKLHGKPLVRIMNTQPSCQKKLDIYFQKVIVCDTISPDLLMNWQYNLNVPDVSFTF